MKADKTRNNKEKKNLKPATVIYTAMIVIVSYVIFIGILIYGFNSDNRLTRFTERFIPYPAAIMNYTHLITTSELKGNISAIQNFYEKQDFSKIGLRVDFTTPDGQKRLKVRERELFNKMIEDKAIEIIARKNGINISSDEISQNVSRKLEEYGDKDEVTAKLASLYGWTLDDFKEKVVRPSMYKEELEKLITDKNHDEFSSAALEKINKAFQELKEKKDFAQVAKTYSEGTTAGEGGELGWFKKDQLVPEISNVIFSFDKGKQSDIIESSLGYHIVEVEDKKTENNAEMVKIRQIFTRKYAFSDWLAGQLQNMKIFIPLKDYTWNHDQALVEFKSQDMKDYEKNIIENYQGDASVIF